MGRLFFARYERLTRLVTLELAKEYFHFSAAHFTIFSGSNRERLHGHNFRAAVNICAEVEDSGLCFDYAEIKQLLKSECEALDEYTLIAGLSKHLSISSNDTHYIIGFDQDTLHIPLADVIVLPVRNVSIEELSHYLLQKVIDSHLLETSTGIKSVEIKVSSGPNQWASSHWQKRT